MGKVLIGHGHPIAVQSMTNTDTRDIGKTIKQIKTLSGSGCELIRVAVPDGEAAQAIKGIVEKSPLPVIADIHFDHRLALQAMKAGAAGIRINPGNIGSPAQGHPGHRGGQGSRGMYPDRGQCRFPGKGPAGKREEHLAEAMVTSALRHIELFEQFNFNNLKISLKASDVLQTIRAYQVLAPKVPYPFHLGVTEAGTLISGTVKSALGIGLLLYQGIGDTLRVSLTAQPREEIRVAFELLRDLRLRERGVEIISCPTCGRCQIDLIPLVQTG